MRSRLKSTTYYVAVRLARSILSRFGLELTRAGTQKALKTQLRITKRRLKKRIEYPRDFTESEIETIRSVRPFTLTSPERIVSLIRAVEYVALNNIPGSIVECGVWRGGSMMAIALTLLRLNKGNVPLYLFDTFAGMSAPTAIDGVKKSIDAEEVYEIWKDDQTPTHNRWIFASLAEVKNNLQGTGYDENLVHFIKGKVENTLPESAPEQISLLRLDTDFYESTKHELEHLYPRLSRGGVLIIDDYGHFEGARKAVDEYIERNRLTIFLNRVDYTGRIGIKCCHQPNHARSR